MSTTIVQSTARLINHSDFIKEITGPHTSDLLFIGKREPLLSDEMESQSSLKMHILPREEKAVHSEDKSDSEHSMVTEDASFREISGLSNQQFCSPFPKDLTACYRLLLKHFLTETLLNGVFNLQRFNVLPDACQQIVLNFLRRQFDFVLDDEIEAGNNRKYLYPLRGKTYQTTDRSSVSLSFLVDCYVYGVVKQLQQNGKQVSKEEAVKLLHGKLQQSGVAIEQQKFALAIESLLNYPTDRVIDPAAEISCLLLDKIVQIKESTLVKFYSKKISLALSDIFDGCSSTEELENSAETSTTKIDLLSAYFGKNMQKAAAYRSKLLSLV